VHLVLATQRPAGVVRDDVRANTELRLCLRVADRADALDVVGDARPASFDRRQPGRVLLRSGAGEVVQVQVVDTSRPWESESPSVQVRAHGWQPLADAATHATTRAGSHGSSTLATVVDALAEAAVEHGYERPGRLWQPALPVELSLQPGTDDGTVVGMLDDVEHQRWLPLRCDPTRHAVIIGGPRSGVTTALARLVATRSDHHVVEVPANGPCTPVMERLLTVLDDRQRRPADEQPITVVVDDVGALRRRWEHELGTAAWQIAGWWDRLLSDGPAVGMVLIAGADRVASCGATLLSVAGTRWLMRPLDPLDPAHLGVRWPIGPGEACPPGRLVDVATGLMGQVAFSTPSTMCTVRSA
jgi:S-DNA-T family DNA segregation ATPase FtsK/SpoIIIE